MRDFVTIDRATLEQIVAVADKFINKVETGQARSVETYDDLIAVRKSCRAAIANAESVDTDDVLMREALYALEYAADMTKPEGLSGCDCPICTSTIALQKRLGEKI